MIIDLGGYEFDLGDEENKIEVAFPMTFDGNHLVIKTTLEKMEEDDILLHYACGDTLNYMGQLVAGTQCNECPEHRISMEMVVRSMENEEEEFYQLHKSVTVTCREHALISLSQVIFMSGLLASREIQ